MTPVANESQRGSRSNKVYPASEFGSPTERPNDDFQDLLPNSNRATNCIADGLAGFT
jgi:hypothetical protein